MSNAWIEEHKRDARERLKRMNEGELRAVLADVKGTLAVEGLKLDPEHEALLMRALAENLSDEAFRDGVLALIARQARLLAAKEADDGL